MSSIAASANGQTSEYSIPITTDLNIDQTIVEVQTSKDYEGPLRQRILDRFSQAGLGLPLGPQKVTGQDVTLRFTQLEIPLDPACPKKVFYMARRELIEPVTIKRSNERMVVGHWDVTDASEVRDPVPFEELESSLDRRLGISLYNYQLGKQYSALHKQADDARKGTGRVQEDSTRKEVLESRQVQKLKLGGSNKFVSGGVATLMEEEVWGSLRGLSMDNVYFDAFDKSNPEFTFAREQLLNAEMIPHVLFSEVKDSNRAARLALTLDVQSLESVCQGQVLYKSGLALREKVLIERNGLETWADTWGSYRVQIRPPLTQKELDEEQLQLINLFIHEYRNANLKK